MNARFLTTATLTALFAGLLPATAADPQLLNLVMPDAKVLAGVNVDQEMTNLIQLQTAYGANARVMTAIRDMLDALMKI